MSFWTKYQFGYDHDLLRRSKNHAVFIQDLARSERSFAALVKVQFRPRLVLQIVKGTLQLPPPLCSATERASAQASFFLKGIYVNPHSQTPECSVQCRCSAAHKTRGEGKAKEATASLPHHLSSAGGGLLPTVRRFACLLASSASAAPRLRPASQPASAKSSDPAAPSLDLPGRPVRAVCLPFDGLASPRGVSSSDTCCGAAVSASRVIFPSRRQE